MQRQLDYYQVMEDAKKTSYQKKIVLVLDGAYMPENIAGIFRTADAFQVERILLTEHLEFQNSKRFKSIARVSADRLNFQWLPTELLKKEIEGYKQKSYCIAAIEYTNQSTVLPKLELDQDLVLVLGAEKYGVSEEILDVVDLAYHVPMLGQISSLNVMTAAGIALYEARRSELL